MTAGSYPNELKRLIEQEGDSLTYESNKLILEDSACRNIYLKAWKNCSEFSVVEDGLTLLLFADASEDFLMMPILVYRVHVLKGRNKNYLAVCWKLDFQMWVAGRRIALFMLLSVAY
jgi:hypothetical protein